MTWTTRLRSKTNGLAAITAGDGPPILLLHGVGLRAEAWNRQIDGLARDFHLIAPDMLGHGESVPASGQTSVSDYTDSILALIHDPVLVVGHSMGAMIALDMAIRFPEQVRGVAALNAIWKRTAEAAAAVRDRAESLDGRTPADPASTLSRWFDDAVSPERNACAKWLRDVNPAGYKTAYTAFAKGDGPNETALTHLSCPALFMTGQMEPNSTPQMSQAMAKRAPQGRAIIVEGAAHMMPITHAEVVTAALLDFAREVWT
ncbi:alpha/beta hydrolase [uncultured Tateyamaria sp.]|uniref:alpha/beta fold hydrolase n=1 Tax=uncultured Tateyamaria sp. TaxID=455651 RepID=UPI0026199DE0|nr:alpha/beta hydrolase [uncultured Tateyamaria sp.]